MPADVFPSAFGDFSLSRFPDSHDKSLRAWDAADDYLLNELKRDEGQFENPLIINDGFGALTTALHTFNPQSWGDSWLAHEATRRNLDRNHLDTDAVTYLASTDAPDSSPGVVLLKVPKTLALLEAQLSMLKPLLAPDTTLYAAGMTRNLPASTWQILERVIGPTDTLPAVRKAKLIKVTIDPDLVIPERALTTWPLEGTNYNLANHENVFSREQLDIGARFLLSALPVFEGSVDIIDLGCGNGVLGLMVAHQNREARVTFVDESYMAVASACLNLQQLPDAHTNFVVGNGLADFASREADVVLCNPPFHQGHAVGDHIATSMFRDAARVLRDTGECWVVGNRHLQYHHKLRQVFGSVELTASNRKFVVLRGRQPKR